MIKNKTYTWQIIYTVSIIFSLYCYIKWGAIVLLCDSDEPINDFIINDISDNSENNVDNNSRGLSVPPQGLLFKFKRRLSWYLNGKKSGKYKTYNDFKNSFSSDTRLRNIIKDDFNFTKVGIAKRRREEDQRFISQHEITRKKLEKEQQWASRPDVYLSRAQESYLSRRLYDFQQAEKYRLELETKYKTRINRKKWYIFNKNL